MAGLSATATIGFAAAGLADTDTPSPGTSGKAPTEKPASAELAVSGPSSVKSSHTATYAVTLKVTNGPLKDATVTPGGSWHGGTIKWTGCTSVDGVTCKLGEVSGSKTLHLAYSAPKVSKNTSATLIVSAKGTAGDKELSAPAQSRKLVVNKPATSSPTPTKTSKPTPTKTSHKPSPTKSHQGHTPSHNPSHKPSHAPSPAPTGDGHVPIPTSVPSWPSSEPSLPAGTQKPWSPPTGVPTDAPTLPSVAPSPEGSPRNPNVAEPPHKASGQVQTDAVSVPAAAAAAFIGIGAGTIITRAVRRRGLWHPIGRHRD